MTSPAQSPILPAVVAQGNAQAAAQTLAATFAAGQVAQMSGQDWYSTAAITRMAQTVAGYVQSVQRNQARTTDAYLASVGSLIKGRPMKPVGLVDVSTLRNRISPAGPYGRLADNYRWLRSEGKTDGEAQQQVAGRARTVATDDVNFAARSQARKFMVVHSVDGFRRIIHPELSKTGTCGLCLAASDRTYQVDHLMPLHGNCKCTVLPIINGVDPGRDVNAADLKALYGAAGSTNRADLVKVRYSVHENGETGPVLAMAGDHFRTPSDLPAAA